MSEPFLGQLMIFAGNFAPRGWATCDGQILSIAQNTALFSLLGTTYGGNGQTTFALPDLRGRVPIHQGQGPGLSPYTEGEVGGVESVTLINTQMPSHNHTATNAINAAYGPQSPSDNPAGAVPAGTSGGPQVYAPASDGTVMNPQTVVTTIGIAGGSQPHENRQPYLCILFCIALEGIFPPRN
jgi:microcystin-dependent protein